MEGIADISQNLKNNNLKILNEENRKLVIGDDKGLMWLGCSDISLGCCLIRGSHKLTRPNAILMVDCCSARQNIKRVKMYRQQILQ
jgi:hypothetical protein